VPSTAETKIRSSKWIDNKAWKNKERKKEREEAEQ